MLPILGAIAGFFIALFGIGGLLPAGRKQMQGARVEGAALEAAV